MTLNPSIKELLSPLQERQTSIEIFLLNGIRLIGKLDNFNEQCLVLNDYQHRQIVFFHAISTIQMDAETTPMTHTSYKQRTRSGLFRQRNR